MLKIILLSGPLAYIYKCSFLFGIVPKNLKIARVIPVHKKRPRAIISNYRPISLLSYIFNNILEKLKYKRLSIWPFFTIFSHAILLIAFRMHIEFRMLLKIYFIPVAYFWV